jgi:hypothetical protein
MNIEEDIEDSESEDEKAIADCIDKKVIKFNRQQLLFLYEIFCK